MTLSRPAPALFLALCAVVVGCDSEGSPPVPDVPLAPIVWTELAFPTGPTGPSEAVATQTGAVYVNFVRVGDELHRVESGAFMPAPFPPGLGTPFGYAYLASDPLGGLTAVVEDNNGTTTGADDGVSLVENASGSGWVRVGSLLAPSLIRTYVHGGASNGRGSGLLVAQGGPQYDVGTLYRTAGGSAWLAATMVAGLTPAGTPVFADEHVAFVNGADNPSVGNFPFPDAAWQLLRSTDSGITWAPSTLPPSAAHYVVRRGPGSALLAFSLGRLYASRDTGRTWAAVALPEGLGDVAEASLTPAGGYLVVFRRLVSDSFYGAISVRYSPAGEGTWVEAGAGISPLVSDPYLSTVGSPDVKDGGRSSLARDAAGYYYLLLYRETRGTTRSTIVRTAAPVP